MADAERGTTVIGDEKVISDHKEGMMRDVAHDAAERGHLATDEYGQPLFQFDKAAESRLRLKIDLYIVPTVALMYLFCFIDRANVGVWPVPLVIPRFYFFSSSNTNPFHVRNRQR
jgi:hypothetical protein